ncbi:MAG: hypothetical protein ACFFC6_07745 [Promethearchaeota archaeon]
MKMKNFLRHSWSGMLIVQFLFMVLTLQVLQTPIVPQEAVASPPTHLDNIWEDPDGLGLLTNNSRWAWAYDLGSESITNPDSLNVSSNNPDYYNFSVQSGFYFSISITFNQSNAWNETGYLIDLDPLFYADLDLYLWSQSGTLLGYSNYSGYEEIISPILINTSETVYFNVTCANPFGYEGLNYSTIYNMSVVYEDKWERFESNDDISSLTPPDNPGGSDDEIVPGYYEKLRFSSDSVTEYGKNDTYLILLYNGSRVTITVESYSDPVISQPDGVDMHLIYYNYSQARYISVDFEDPDQSNAAKDTFQFIVNSSRWYYLRFSQRLANYYTLEIILEDEPEELSGMSNHYQDQATEVSVGYYPGMVVSRIDHDWYSINVAKYQRLHVDVNWIQVQIPDGGRFDINLTVYENQSTSSILDDPNPILNGLRFGPHRALTDSVYYIHVSSNNTYPLYYNLTITILGEDDWAEENDLFIYAYLLQTQSREYKPTETDPDAGLISLEGDMDWYAISLLPGDWITVRIDFNGTNADLNLFFADATGNILDSSVLSGSSSETISYRVSKSDVYLLLVLGVGPPGYGFAQYNMTVDIDLFDDFLELPNNDFGSAAPIAEGSYTNLILRDDLYDYYYVYLDQDDTINISLDYFPEEFEEAGDILINDIDLELYSDYTGSEYPRVAESITVLNESISYTATVSGQYFILCIIWGGETPNTYNLTIDVKEIDDAHEDNDVLGDATRITVVEGPTRDTVSHTETARIRIKDDDYFVVKVPAGLAIIVEISQFGSENLDLELLALNGSIIDSSLSGAGYPEQVGPFPMNSTYTNIHNGTDIYFRVFMDSGLSTSYQLNVTLGPEDVLIPQGTVPPFSKSPTKVKPFNPLEALIPLAIGGAILGGGAAGGLYAAKKTGVLDKGVKKIQDFRKRPPKKPGGGAPLSKSSPKTPLKKASPKAPLEKASPKTPLEKASPKKSTSRFDDDLHL